MFVIHPYKDKSKSAKRLGRELGARVMPKHGATYEPSKYRVINWGDGECPHKNVLNPPEAVRRMANKRNAFVALQQSGVPVPPFATRESDVTWDSLTVVRHKLQGHSGQGVELVEGNQKLPDAPLYVKYIPKKDEYRIHVGRSGKETRIIAEQRKARSYDVPDDAVDWQVRTHANGFVFTRQGFTTPPCVLQAAMDALKASGLDFGAVDVIYNDKENRAYVLEINTAPGLEGQTITDYAEYFRGNPGMEVSR